MPISCARCWRSLLRADLRFAAERLMELEVEAAAGAPKGERSAHRTAQRNGCRERGWETRAGRRGLGGSSSRSHGSGGAPPSPPSSRGARPRTEGPRASCEGARGRRPRQACVHGVSTRSVDAPVRAMGGGVSRSRVSRLCAEIDERVGAPLARPIEGRWPRLRLDATSLKVREDGVRACPRTGGGHALTVSRAVMVAVAVNEDGRREVLGVATGPSEAEIRLGPASSAASARRGLRGVKLVIAHDHKGLRAAAGRVFSATRQRCRVHWARNALSHVGTKPRGAVSATRGTVFARKSKAAVKQGGEVADALRARHGPGWAR